MCDKPKPVPHKHAAAIKAWADGHVIQLQKSTGTWVDLETTSERNCIPAFDSNFKYRIKPEPTDLEKYGVEVGDVWEVCTSKHGYVAATVCKLTDVARHYRCTEGHIRTVTDTMTLLFRRGEVNKL